MTTPNYTYVVLGRGVKGALAKPIAESETMCGALEAIANTFGRPIDTPIEMWIYYLGNPAGPVLQAGMDFTRFAYPNTRLEPSGFVVVEAERWHKHYQNHCAAKAVEGNAPNV